jgi:uncharacterized protein (TIGR00251 family)
MADPTIRENEGGVIFTAKVVPGSSKTTIAGAYDGMLKVKVSAPAEKGRANRCLLDFLAKKLSVKRRAVSIISGRTNPVKVVQVLGISSETLLKRLSESEEKVQLND